MSRYTGYLCDKCGDKFEEEETASVQIATGYHRKAIAEDDSYNLYARGNLCIKCAGHAITYLVDELILINKPANYDYERGKEICEKIMPKFKGQFLG